MCHYNYTYQWVTMVFIILFMYMLKSPTAGPGDEKAITPAVNILQSTEKVVSAIASTLSKDENSSTLSRPNLGKTDPASKIISVGIVNIGQLCNSVLLYCMQISWIFVTSPYTVINVQRFTFDSGKQGAVFPRPGLTLPTFRMPESLPHIHLPRAFISAAIGKKMSPGRLQWYVTQSSV